MHMITDILFRIMRFETLSKQSAFQSETPSQSRKLIKKQSKAK